MRIRVTSDSLATKLNCFAGSPRFPAEFALEKKYCDGGEDGCTIFGWNRFGAIIMAMFALDILLDCSASSIFLKNRKST